MACLLGKPSLQHVVPNTTLVVTFAAHQLANMCLQEIQQLYELIQDDINPQKIVQQTLADLPALSRQLILGWSDRVLSS